MMTNLIRKATDKFDLDKSLSNNRVNKKVSICSKTTLNIKSMFLMKLLLCQAIFINKE